MGINKPIMAVMAILVTVLIVATVAVPMIEGSSKEITTVQQNTDNLYYAQLSDLNDISITKTESNCTISYGDPNLDKVITSGSKAVYILGSNDAFISYGNDTLNLSLLSSYNPVSIESAEISNNEMIVTKSVGGTQTITLGSDAYVVSKTGDFGLFDKPFKINRDSAIQSTFGIKLKLNETMSATVKLTVSGPANNLKVVSTVPLLSGDGAAGLTATFENGKINSTVTENSDGLSVTLNGFSGTVKIKTSDNQTFDVDVGSPYQLTFAPIEYRIISENDSAMLSILSIIPILLFIVPVFVAVAALRGRTD